MSQRVFTATFQQQTRLPRMPPVRPVMLLRPDRISSEAARLIMRGASALSDLTLQTGWPTFTAQLPASFHVYY